MVLVGGIFDIIHKGHVHFLEHAKSLGDELVVVVGTDRNARKQGKNPIHNEKERLSVVSALRPVDRAVIGSNKDMRITLKRIHPSIIFLGYDQKLPEVLWEYCKSKGIEVLRDSCSLNPRRYKTTLIKERIAATHPRSRAEHLIHLAKNNVLLCPWCSRQLPGKYLPHLRSEVDELEEAFRKKDLNNIKEEIGDIIWDAVVLAHLCQKRGMFKIEDVFENVILKMSGRKPFLLDGKKVTLEEAERLWREGKAREKKEMNTNSKHL
ncbi:MAG: MazG nucleotide pyrophosphohydrolase domain-containing protein [Candidatus Micrarchaeia archaeon]